MKLSRLRLPASLLATPLALVALGAGCGDDPAPPVTVTLAAADTALLAIRDEGGDWRALEPGAEVTAEVTGPFTVATVCDQPGWRNYYTLSATPEDADVFEVWCTTASPGDVTVTASPDQVGELFVWYFGLSAAEVGVLAPGTYDVFAVDDTVTPPRVAVQRGVEITADTTLYVDVVAEGVPVTEAALTVGGDDPFVTTALFTATSTRARLRAPDGDTAYVFPASVVRDTDSQRVSASASAATSPAFSAGASVEVAPGATTVALELPAPMTAAQRDLGATPTVSWTAPGAWTERYWYMANADFTVLWDAFAMPGYVEATGAGDALEIPDPAELPGWQAAWNLTDAASFAWYLTLSREAGDDGRQSTSYDSAFEEARQAPARARLDAQRARVDARR
jgi:hypothetical protein